MSGFVLDASVALSWFVDHPVHPYAVQVRDRIRAGMRALVPCLWELEFANGLLIAERRKIILAAVADEGMAEVQRLRNTGIEMEVGSLTIREVLALARSHQLTAYDASYLELAKREGVPLATLDKGLETAAKKTGVSLL